MSACMYSREGKKKQRGERKATFCSLFLPRPLSRAALCSLTRRSALAKYGVCSQKDVEELLFTDDVQEAFEFITSGLEFQLSASSFGADYGE